MNTKKPVEDTNEKKRNARHKEIVGIMMTLFGAILLLISYFYDQSIPFGAYFGTLTIVGAIISVYYERKYYSL